jgi:RNA polymerase sigma-70 factor (ECF subfamily)
VASDLQRVSDEDLARGAQAGSLAAFEELVYRYEQRIYAFVTHWCRNSADAQELTQDTFVRAFQAIARFDPRRGFAPWLFTIARRKCIDHHRAAPPALAEEAMLELPEAVDPAQLLAQREERENLWRIARRCLAEAQFQALWLRYTEDMSVAGIARVLGKTQTHVKVLLFRARDALGRELRKAQALGRTFPCVAADVSRRGLGGGQNAPTGVGGHTLSLNRAKCEIEFPGVVAGLGPGSGKKGLL